MSPTPSDEEIENATGATGTGTPDYTGLGTLTVESPAAATDPGTLSVEVLTNRTVFETTSFDASATVNGVLPITIESGDASGLGTLTVEPPGEVTDPGTLIAQVIAGRDGITVGNESGTVIVESPGTATESGILNVEPSGTANQSGVLDVELVRREDESGTVIIESPRAATESGTVSVDPAREGDESGTLGVEVIRRADESGTPGDEPSGGGDDGSSGGDDGSSGGDDGSSGGDDRPERPDVPSGGRGGLGIPDIELPGGADQPGTPPERGTPNPRQWAYDFSFGSFNTQSVIADTETEQSDSLSRITLSLIVDEQEARIIEESLSKIVSVRETQLSGGNAVVADESADDRNTFTVNPPSAAAQSPVQQGEYIATGWETEWRGDNFRVTIEALKK